MRRWIESGYVRFLAFTLLLFAVLFLRKPDSLLNPQFFAEDGQIFYTEQLVSGWSSVLVPYNGYLSLMTRLAAGVESLFPASAAPLWCALIGLALQAGSYAFLILRECRYLIRSDALRVAAALVITIVLDGNEMIGNSVNIQWHAILPGLILLFLPNAERVPGTRGSWRDAAIFLAAAAISLSASLMVITLPMALWRWVTRERRERAIAAIFATGFVVQISIFAVTSLPVATAAKPADAGLTISSLAISTFVAWLYRVVLESVLGTACAAYLNQIAGQWAVALAFVLVAAAAFWLWVRNGREQRKILAVCFYLTAASLAVSLTTRHLIQYFQPGSGHAIFIAPRYFAMAIYILLFLLASQLESVPWRASVRAKAAALVAIFAIGIVSNFRVPPYQDTHWARGSAAIDAWISARRTGRIASGVRVEIVPSPWAVSLPQVAATP